jgi:type I restriction enzyme S subunit
VPPFDEQRRIVDAIEEQFSRLNAGSELLDRVSKRLALLDRLVLAAVGYGKWERVPVGSLAEVQGGIQKQPKRRPISNKYPFLRVANVRRGSLDLTEVHQIELFGDELNRYRLRRGDLLVVEGNGSRSQIGRSALWDGSIDPCVHQNHLIRIRPGPRLLPEFLNSCWNSGAVLPQIYSVASSTSGLYTLSTAKVRSILIPVPPIDEQIRLVSLHEEQQTLINALQIELRATQERCDRLRHATLRDAFTGQLVSAKARKDPTA